MSDSDLTSQVKVALLCEVRILRKGLSQCLAADHRVLVSGELASLDAAEQYCLQHHPDVLLFDASLPNVRAAIDGWRRLRQTRASWGSLFERIHRTCSD